MFLSHVSSNDSRPEQRVKVEGKGQSQETVKTGQWLPHVNPAEGCAGDPVSFENHSKDPEISQNAEKGMDP